jgi:hypothetical protein
MLNTHKSPVSIGQIAGLAVLAGIALGVIVNLKDIARYIRISMM